MITYDIKKNLPALSIERRRSRNAVVGGRDLRYTQVPQPRTHTTPVARWNIARTSLHFDIPGPEAPTRRTSLFLSGSGRQRRSSESPLVLLHRIGKGRGRCTIVYARVPPYRTHRTHSYTYLPRIRTRGKIRICRTYYVVMLVNGRRIAYRILFPRNHMPHSSLRAPPLCFFVRAKIINGQTEARYPEVSASWQWRSSHFESPPFRPFLLLHFPHQPRTKCVIACDFDWRRRLLQWKQHNAMRFATRDCTIDSPRVILTVNFCDLSYQW